MKKIWLFLSIIGCIACGTLYAFNPFKKESWEKAGRDVKKGLGKAGEEIGGAAKAVLGTSPECKEMRALAVQWAAKEAEYAATQAGVQLATKGVEAAQKVVQGTLDAGKGATDISSAVLKLGANVIDKGINIKRVYLSGKITDFKKGAFPEFQVQGSAFGKDFNVKLQLDLSKPLNMTKLLIKKVF